MATSNTFFSEFRNGSLPETYRKVGFAGFLDRSTVWWSDLMGWAARAFLSSIHPCMHASVRLDTSEWSVNSDFTHFQWEYLHQTFRIYLWHGLVHDYSFFGQKNFGVKGHDPKRGKTVKIYLLLQFLT